MKNQSTVNEEVKFVVNAKEIHGILTRPDSDVLRPAVVLLQGSDRAGANDPYYVEHAEQLVRSGFAVLRCDGSGWGGGGSGSGFETLEYRTEEALAALKYLQARPDIKPNAVGLWGVSQGGWICQMAAASYDGVAFIIPVSGPGVTPAEQEAYRVKAESRAAGFDEDEIAKAVLMRRLMVDIVLSAPMYREVNLSEARRLGGGAWSELTELTYNPVEPVAEYGKVIEILKGVKDERWATFLHLDEVLPMLESFPPQAWGMVKTQMRAVMEVDPADFLTKVRCPVLAIFGEKDTSIPVEKSAALYKQYLDEAGNKSLTVKVFDNASHTIRVGGTFADGYFDLMVNWLSALAIG
jgi:dienelactone hydrolase